MSVKILNLRTHVQRLRARLADRAGESLAETLVSIALVSMSAAMLVSAVYYANTINADVERTDARIREQQIAAELQTSFKGRDTVTLDGRTYDVNVYGSGTDDDAIVSYALAE